MCFPRNLFICVLAASCLAGSAMAELAPKQATQKAAEQAPADTSSDVTRNDQLPAEAQKVSATEAAMPDAEQSVAFKSIEQLNELTQIGLSGLAMRMIEQQQKLYTEFTADWYAFEFKHIETLSSL